LTRRICTSRACVHVYDLDQRTLLPKVWGAECVVSYRVVY
jgi:hypothetical protein